MPHANVTLSQEERDAAAADKPLLSSRNSAEDQTAMEWNEVGTVAATDRNLTDFPPENAVDTFLHVETKPNTGAVTSNEWYLILTLPTGVEYDWAGVFGHNFATLPGAVLVELQIADDAAFSVNLETIASWSPGASTKRLVELVLDLSSVPVGLAQRFTGDHFARLRITNGGGADFVPEVGELVLGRRRQLKHQPNRPWGPDNVRRLARFFTGGGGGRIAHVDAERLFHYVGQIEPADTVRIQDIVDLRDDSLGFTRPIVWISKPATVPADAIWFWSEGDEFQFDEIGPTDRVWAFDLTEDGFLPIVTEA